MKQKSKSVRRVIWADQQALLARRSTKSVGKTKVKVGGSDFSFRPPSADGKKKAKPIILRTEMEESLLSEDSTPINSKANKGILVKEPQLDQLIACFSKRSRRESAVSTKKAKLIDNLISQQQNQLNRPSARIALDLDNISKKECEDDDQNCSGKPRNLPRSQAELGLNDPSLQPGDVRLSNTTEDFYKKGFKDFHKRIFAKTSDQMTTDVSKQKNSYSKVSTNVQEDSSKRTPNDSDANPVIPNFSFVQNLNPVASDVKGSLTIGTDRIVHPKVKLNKTSEPIGPREFADRISNTPSHLHTGLASQNEQGLLLNQYGKIKIPKRKGIEPFLKPQDMQETPDDQKLDLLSKLKRLSSEKLVQLSSNNAAKDRISVKSTHPDIMNLVNAHDDKLPLGRLQRPNSAPSKDDKKEKLIQKQMFLEAKIKEQDGRRSVVQPPQIWVSKVQSLGLSDIRSGFQPNNKCKPGKL